MIHEGKITESFVKNLPFSDAGQKLYFDSELRGFGICVGKKSKTYFVQREVHRKTVRTKIDRHGPISAYEARQRAQQALAELGKGINLNEKKRQQRQKNKTLGELFEEYLTLRNSSLRNSTKVNYIKLMAYVKDWNKKEIQTISTEMVRKKHAEISKSTKVTANHVMRAVRMAYNYAIIRSRKNCARCATSDLLPYCITYSLNSFSSESLGNVMTSS